MWLRPVSFSFAKLDPPPVCPERSGGGKMEWIPRMRARENFRRCSLDKLFVIAQKSSTNTSSRLVVKAAVWSLSHVSTFSSIFVSKWCDGQGVFAESKFSMMSRAVSVAAQKYGGDSHHPIWRELGTTISISSMLSTGEVDGMT